MNRIATAIACALAVASSRAAYAQPTAAPLDPPTVSTLLDADVIGDLPSDGTVLSLLETTEPSLIADRISGGGLYTGQAPRIGGFLSSWSQTLYRLGEVSVSDPTGSGTPLLIPDIDLWRAVTITTGMQPAYFNGAGVVISLDPGVPSSKWTTKLSGMGFGSNSSGTFPAGIDTRVSPLAVLGSGGWDRASGVASGPLVTDAAGNARLSGFFAASWTRGRTRLAGNPSALETGTSGSAFAHLVFAPRDTDAVHVIGWVQKNTPAAGSDNTATHLQGIWERRVATARSLRLFGAYTQRVGTAANSGQNLTIERLTEGPLDRLAFDAASTVRQWTVGARLPAARAGNQTLEGGLEIGGARDRSTGFYQGVAGELVDGHSARVWVFNPPAAAQSLRHERTIDGHIEDSFTAGSHVIINAGLRFESVDASAEGAAARISWQTWLPRARAAWTIAPAWRPTIFAGLSRTAYELPLDLLAIGDPGAPTANVYQWLPVSDLSVKSTGALIATIGPGSNGNASFAQIDSDLKRPTTDELTVGIDAHPLGALTLRAAGFLRRERNRIALTDTGTLATAFTLSGVPDPGLQLENPADDQVLPVYNRNVSSLGQGRYLLTNSGAQAATSKSIEISAELRTPHVILFGGASANQSEGSAAAVGAGPLENDQTIVGDLFVDPNAATFDRGRVFTDRAYTIKVATILRLPQDVRVGVIARYQDGQPFSRLVVVPDLHQGAEAIRAFPNGQSRFTFTETVDMKVQKGFRIGRDKVDAVLEVFNLLGTKNETEERMVSGSTFRAITATQPPRAFHAGFVVTF